MAPFALLVTPEKSMKLLQKRVKNLRLENILRFIINKLRPSRRAAKPISSNHLSGIKVT